MATIEKRISNTGEITYRAKVRLRGFPVQTATFDKMTKAKEWAYTTEQKMKDGKFMPEYKAKQYTVSEIIDKYR